MYVRKSFGWYFIFLKTKHRLLIYTLLSLDTSWAGSSGIRLIYNQVRRQGNPETMDEISLCSWARLWQVMSFPLSHHFDIWPSGQLTNWVMICLCRWKAREKGLHSTNTIIYFGRCLDINWPKHIYLNHTNRLLNTRRHWQRCGNSLKAKQRLQAESIKLVRTTVLPLLSDTRNINMYEAL